MTPRKPGQRKGPEPKPPGPRRVYTCEILSCGQEFDSLADRLRHYQNDHSYEEE